MTVALVNQVRETSLQQALALLPPEMTSERAVALLLTIGLQESSLIYRDQLESGGRDLVDGPAMGFWQFEKNGGVAGVLEHPLTARHARVVCTARGVKPERYAVWKAMETDDVLAAAMARLLLWTDPMPLPKVGEVAKAWDYYLRCWRPGKPHRHRWDACYATVMDAITQPA